MILIIRLKTIFQVLCLPFSSSEKNNNDLEIIFIVMK